MSQRSPVLVTATLAAAGILALATEISAKTLALDADFSPQPIVTEMISVSVDKTRLEALGFSKCGGNDYTTKAPAFTFQLTEEHPELRVRFEYRDGSPAYLTGAVIKFPNKKYVCSSKSQVYVAGWPKGTYEVWFHGNNADVSTRLRFENPARSKQAVADARATLPTVTLGGGGGANPAVTKVERTAAGEAADVGIGCAGARDRVMPLAALEVTQESSFFLGATAVDLFVITADGECVEPEKAPVLAVGTHALWGIVSADGAPKNIGIEVDDRKRAFQPYDAPHKPVGDLAHALVIDGKVRTAEGWGWAWRGRCEGSAYAPDFYVTSDRPLQNVELSLLWGREPMNLHVFGPIEQMKPTHKVECGKRADDPPRTYDLFEGTYAVWVGTDLSRDAKADATGAAYHVVLRRKDEAVYPMTTYVPIPADLTMAERAIDHHYPHFDGGGEPFSNDYYDAWKTLFTQAPDQLFVYARVDIDDAETPVKAGEPLIVGWSDAAETGVRRHDGQRLEVKTALLTIDRPAAVWLPEKPEVRAYEGVLEAQADVGPEDAAKLDAFWKLDEKFYVCHDAYLEKNDPTYGTGTEVYKVSGNGRVVNVGAEMGERADAKCGRSKVEKAETKLLADLAKTRAARHAARLAAVRQRFGL